MMKMMMMGRSLVAEAVDGTRPSTNTLVEAWLRIRAPVIAPVLQLAVDICLLLVIMMFVDRMSMAALSAYFRLLGKRPEKQYKWEAITHDRMIMDHHDHDHDGSITTSSFPKVLVQIPMFNEKEVGIPVHPVYSLYPFKQYCSWIELLVSWCYLVDIEITM